VPSTVELKIKTAIIDGAVARRLERIVIDAVSIAMSKRLAIWSGTSRAAVR
jgi:hypothetical protein